MTDSYSAILFDLDNTLVLTDPLKTLRAKRRWRDVLRSLDKTSTPPGTLDFLDGIKNEYGLPVGVVTRAPRIYAEGILRHHGIKIDALVAYHDVIKKKPDPEAIALAAKLLGTKSKNCIYIGDPEGGVDRLTALNAGSMYIEIDWHTAGARWDDVLAEIKLLLPLNSTRPNSHHASD